MRAPNIPRQLLAWRLREHLSQSQAAVRLGIPIKTLQNWEQAARTPRGLARRQLLELIKHPKEQTMKTSLSIGQRVTVDIWCCGKKAPAMITKIGRFCVDVECDVCKSRHSVRPEQIKPVP